MAEVTLSTGNLISYHDSGSGTPILFLHSFGHNKNMWFPQLTHFTELGYRVIAPDMPGHGDSSFDPDNHSPSGEKNGLTPPSVSAIGTASAWSKGR